MTVLYERRGWRCDPLTVVRSSRAHSGYKPSPIGRSDSRAIYRRALLPAAPARVSPGANHSRSPRPALLRPRGDVNNHGGNRPGPRAVSSEMRGPFCGMPLPRSSSRAPPFMRLPARRVDALQVRFLYSCNTEVTGPGLGQSVATGQTPHGFAREDSPA